MNESFFFFSIWLDRNWTKSNWSDCVWNSWNNCLTPPSCASSVVIYIEMTRKTLNVMPRLCLTSGKSLMKLWLNRSNLHFCPSGHDDDDWPVTMESSCSPCKSVFVVFFFLGLLLRAPHHQRRLFGSFFFTGSVRQLKWNLHCKSGEGKETKNFLWRESRHLNKFEGIEWEVPAISQDLSF